MSSSSPLLRGLSNYIHISRLRSSSGSVHPHHPHHERETEGGAERGRFLQTQKGKGECARGAGTQPIQPQVALLVSRRFGTLGRVHWAHSSSTLTPTTVRERCIHTCMCETGNNQKQNMDKNPKSLLGFFLPLNICSSAVIRTGVRKLSPDNHTSWF